MKSSVIFVCSTLICLCTTVLGQGVGGFSFGPCPKNMGGMKNFQSEKFKGTWFEVERSFYLMEIASSCTTLVFEPRTLGEIGVTVKTVNRWTGNPSVSLGKATPSFNGSATLKYRVTTKLPPALARALPGAGTYSILGTDYDNYAIMWSCSNMGVMHSVQIWVLARTRELDVSSRARVYDELHELNLDSDKLTLSKNEACPQF